MKAARAQDSSAFTPWIALIPAAAVFLPGLLWPLTLVLLTSFWRDMPGALPVPALTLASYFAVLSDPFYLSVFVNTAAVGILVTSICFFVAYPFAFYLTFVAQRSRTLFVWAIYLPLFISVMVRVIGWTVFLADSGLINTVLIRTGTVRQPLHMLYDMSGMVIGMIHRYLPLMVLPLVAAMAKVDPSWLAASRNLGTGAVPTFSRIVLPLSLPGAVSGCQLVFAGVVSDYVLPMLLGSTRFRMLAPGIYEEAITNFDWPRAAALSVLMVASVAVIVVVSNFSLRRLAPWVKTL
jgi:putative spermidine/putrescine transport system permease protein